MERTKEIEEYGKYLIEEELADSTREIYLREVRRLEIHLAGRMITKEAIMQYKEYMAGLGYAVTTQNLYIIAINRYLRFIGYGDCVVKTKRVQKRQNLEYILTQEEYAALLRYARKIGNRKYYMIMRTLASTGIRIGELSYFTVEVLNKNTIQVTNKKKTREICIPDTLRKELRIYSNENGIKSGAIFLGNRGKAISRIAVYNMLIHLAEMAGISKDKVSPHSFRHLFAVTYMKHYSNLFELADLLGHSRLETTRIYARGTISERVRRMDRLGL